MIPSRANVAHHACHFCARLRLLDLRRAPLRAVFDAERSLGTRGRSHSPQVAMAIACILLNFWWDRTMGGYGWPMWRFGTQVLFGKQICQESVLKSWFSAAMIMVTMVRAAILNRQKTCFLQRSHWIQRHWAKIKVDAIVNSDSAQTLHPSMAKVPLVGVWVDLRDQDCHSQHRFPCCVDDLLSGCRCWRRSPIYLP